MGVTAHWSALLADLPARLLGLSAWLLAALVVCVPLERLWPHRPQRVFRARFNQDVVYFLLGGTLPLFVVVAVIAPLAALLDAHPLPWHGWLARLPLAARVALTVLLAEFVYYWAHRWSHELPWLWRLHAVHHDAEQLDWLVNTRAHPLDLAWSRSLVLTALMLTGAGASADAFAALTAVVVFNTAWGFFIHANCRVRLGPLEQLLTSPAFHHWHHAREAGAPPNRNYAALLPWLDRLFGSYHSPGDRAPASYGINTPLRADTLGQLLLRDAGPIPPSPAQGPRLRL
ncbi:MAG: sterol desaturase family protein [Gammaproteobacteria bacterium]|nr:sterol desaturase family protein [Gammaproteobacteria bacterium]